MCEKLNIPKPGHEFKTKWKKKNTLTAHAPCWKKFFHYISHFDGSVTWTTVDISSDSKDCTLWGYVKQNGTEMRANKQNTETKEKRNKTISACYPISFPTETNDNLLSQYVRE
jgi:hypothetical protein